MAYQVVLEPGLGQFREFESLRVHTRIEHYDPSHYEKTHPHSILQVPTTKLAKMSIDPKFVELTADVLEIFS